MWLFANGRHRRGRWKKMGKYLECWPKYCNFCQPRIFFKKFENFIFKLEITVTQASREYTVYSLLASCLLLLSTCYILYLLLASSFSPLGVCYLQLTTFRRKKQEASGEKQIVSSKQHAVSSKDPVTSSKYQVTICMYLKTKRKVANFPELCSYLYVSKIKFRNKLKRWNF